MMIAARLIPGFSVTNPESALIGAIVIGLLNATLGYFLGFITSVFGILTFGALVLFVNAGVLFAASQVVQSYNVYGYRPAIWAGAALATLSLIIRAVARDE